MPSDHLDTPTHRYMFHYRQTYQANQDILVHIDLWCCLHIILVIHHTFKHIFFLRCLHIHLEGNTTCKVLRNSGRTSLHCRDLYRYGHLQSHSNPQSTVLDKLIRSSENDYLQNNHLGNSPSIYQLNYQQNKIMSNCILLPFHILLWCYQHILEAMYDLGRHEHRLLNHHQHSIKDHLGIFIHISRLSYRHRIYKSHCKCRYASIFGFHYQHMKSQKQDM